MAPSLAFSETSTRPGVLSPHGNAPGSTDTRPVRTRAMPVDRAVNELKTAILQYTHFMAQVDPSRMNLHDFRTLTFRSQTSFTAIHSQFQVLSKILAKNGLTEERKNLERDVTNCRVLHWNLELHPRGSPFRAFPESPPILHLTFNPPRQRTRRAPSSNTKTPHQNPSARRPRLSNMSKGKTTPYIGHRAKPRFLPFPTHPLNTKAKNTGREY